MPHLQFEINKALTEPDKINLAEDAREIFSDVMDTGIEHISITIREFGTYNLSLGRAKEPEKGIALVNADLREGRTLQQRRLLAKKFMELIHTSLNIPIEHIYITLTEHKGEDFHLYERYLANWKRGEDSPA